MQPESNSPSIVPIILAGGEGRRLRPLSGPTRPKPFLKLFSNRSLLQMTLLRAGTFSAPVIVCDERFAMDANDEAEQIGVDSTSIIGEPTQRGTAAAIASAAFLLQEKNPVMLILPSDHVIDSPKIFEATVRRAAMMVTDDTPVILGRKPTAAHDRYGYIRTKKTGEGFALDNFIEKPPLKIARKLCSVPGVFWNTGMFLCRAQTLLKLLSVHAPDIFEGAGNAMAGAASSGNMLRPNAGRYAGIPAVSIDHAIMEKLPRAIVLPLETGWHDVGCWERIFALKFKAMADTLRPPRSYESGRSGSEFPERRSS